MDKQNINYSPNTYIQAFNEGYSKACYDIGYNHGHQAGYNVGYQTGLNQGYFNATNQNIVWPQQKKNIPEPELEPELEPEPEPELEPEPDPEPFFSVSSVRISDFVDTYTHESLSSFSSSFNSFSHDSEFNSSSESS